MRPRISLILLSLLTPLALGCSESGPLLDEGDDKADTEGIRNAITAVTADGELSDIDVDELFEAAGNNVSLREMLTIRDATESSAYVVTDAAMQRALDLAHDANLMEYEAGQLADPIVGYGGNVIKPEVRALVSKARLNGAIVFDIRETSSNGDNRWNPHYPSAAAEGVMAFDYTLITPEILAADVADTDLTYRSIRSSNGVATYEDRRGGTGNIRTRYDKASHSDYTARGESGEKWASNCAFLSDGTVHCLPAVRHSDFSDYILVNPDLSRCWQSVSAQDEDCHTLMYTGHIQAQAGVITSIEVSGRASKRVASGKANLIDPIALFNAWGFELRPGLQVRYGNTSDGEPVANLERGILEAP